ncbi:MAG: hypothetical protein ACKV19_09185 [Verrucomicrobiales bacterium]
MGVLDLSSIYHLMHSARMAVLMVFLIFLSCIVTSPLVAVALGVVYWAWTRRMSLGLRIVYCLLIIGVTIPAVVGVEELRVRFYKWRGVIIMEQLMSTANEEGSYERMQRKVFPGMKIRKWDDQEFEVLFRDRWDMLDWWRLSSIEPDWKLE